MSSLDSASRTRQGREWNTSVRFTPKLYEEYENLPIWTRDKREWVGDSGKEQYFKYWNATIDGWVSQAKSRHGKWKDTCRKALSDIEAMQDATMANSSLDRALAYDPLDIAHAQIQEQTALLSSNLPHGQITATQESENQYVSALNQLIDAEFKSNNFDQTAYDTIYQGNYYNLGWWKTSVDMVHYGVGGQKGEIHIDKVDPQEMHIAPEVKQLSWDYMGFIVHEIEMEIGEIRERWPLTGFLIPETAESPMFKSLQDQKAQDTIISPVPKLAKGSSWKRQKIKVYEAWFKDQRLKFKAQREDREITQTDELGNQTTTIERNALKLDDDGFVMGNWLPAYPRGRCVVVSEGVVLEDMANRLPHGRCPFIPVRQAPSESLLIPGDAVRIVKLAQRINDILSRLHAYMQSEIERPMHASINAFANPQYWRRVPNKSDRIIPLNPNAVFMRPPPVEPPQSTFVLLQQYQQMMDLISGSSAVMRGSISDGAQLSAEALSSLQNFASSRLALKAKYLAGAIKELTFQVMWLIRATYTENIKVQIQNADGTPAQFDWQSDKEIFESGDEDEIAKLTSTESYVIDIKAGTGSPNAQAQMLAMAERFYDKKAIPRMALLDAAQFPNRQMYDKQMQEELKQDLAAEAMGRAVGLQAKRLEKLSGPGGRSKEESGVANL